MILYKFNEHLTMQQVDMNARQSSCTSFLKEERLT